MSRLPILLPVIVAFQACDRDGEFIRPDPTPGLPGVYELRAADGSLIVPADVLTAEDVAASVIYAEVGPSSATSFGGVTVPFEGTGGDVCVWVDPESASWNTDVTGGVGALWGYPDNLRDDGDLDVAGGLTANYTGTNERLGDFRVEVVDSLGNAVSTDLSVCPGIGLGSAGRGVAEGCTVPVTQVGANYTVALQTFSVPRNDDRLAFGVVVANGTCNELRDAVLGNGAEVEQDECLIMGEALEPLELDADETNYTPYYGAAAVADVTLPNFPAFEAIYCNSTQPMALFCEDEADAVAEAGGFCDYTEVEGASRCFCGDPDTVADGRAI